MAIANPGNGFPIYTSILDQVRYKTGDANFCFFADWEYLIPWQLPLDSIPDNFKVFLVGRDIGQTNLDITANVGISCNGTLAVLTYNGEAYRPEFECGYFYIQIKADTDLFFSEMLYIEQRNDFENVGFGALSYNAIDEEWNISASDTRTTDIVSQAIDLKDYPNATGAWTNIGTNSGVVTSLVSLYPLADGTEERFLRRTVELESGAVLQTIYRLNWDPLDPTGTATFIPFSANNKHHRKDRYFLTVTNSGDMKNGDLFLLYDLGSDTYSQRLDLIGFEDFPRGETNLVTLTDGDGNYTVNSIIAKERRAVRFPRIPDESLYFFQLLPKHSTVTLTDTISGRVWTLAETEIKVDSGTGYFSTVELSFRVLSASIAGCDEDLGFGVCGD